MAIAGAVDVIGYMRLSGLYVANMSGNSVGMGLHGAHGEGAQALRSASPVIAFLFGLTVSALILTWGKRHNHRLRLAFVLIAEWVLLVIFGALAGSRSAPFYGLVALGGIAMGLQNSALLHFGPLTVYTTHITGLLTRTAHAFVDLLFWLQDHAPEHPRTRALLKAAAKERVLQLPAMLFGLWILYVVGGVLGALAAGYWGGYAIWAPAALLIGVIAADLIEPIRP